MAVNTNFKFKKMDLDPQYYSNNSKQQYLRYRSFVDPSHFKSNYKILDVGCGEGKISYEIAQLVNEGSVVGIDSSQSMILYARSNFKRNNLTFLCEKAESFSYTDQFNIILCLSCLLWVRKPKIALENFCRLLEKGGELFILTYLKDSSYVSFLEETLKDYPECKKSSAALSMLSPEEHEKTLNSNRIKITQFDVKEETTIYRSKKELKDYLRGWLVSYAKIPEKIQNNFLELAVKNAMKYSSSKSKSEIHLPYKTLKISGIKT